MKWINTAFQFEDIAELCRKELFEVSIKVDKVFLSDGHYYVAWMPMSKTEYETGIQIVCKYIW